MSLKNIRKAYNVPAFRGTRVRVSSPYPGGLGTITSSDRQYIRVRLDGEKRVRRYHPTDRVEYLGILVRGELMKIGQAKGGE